MLLVAGHGTARGSAVRRLSLNLTRPPPLLYRGLVLRNGLLVSARSKECPACGCTRQRRCTPHTTQQQPPPMRPPCSCADRCFNTAHAWQLGWVAPQVLDSTSLPAGGTANATIAAQTRSPNSGLKIKLSSWAAADNIYLGYRCAWRGSAPRPAANNAAPAHCRPPCPEAHTPSRCRLAEAGDATLGSDYRVRVNVYQ